MGPRCGRLRRHYRRGRYTYGHNKFLRKLSPRFKKTCNHHLHHVYQGLDNLHHLSTLHATQIKHYNTNLFPLFFYLSLASMSNRRRRTGANDGSTSTKRGTRFAKGRQHRYRSGRHYARRATGHHGSKILVGSRAREVLSLFCYGTVRARHLHVIYTRDMYKEGVRHVRCLVSRAMSITTRHFRARTRHFEQLLTKTCGRLTGMFVRPISYTTSSVTGSKVAIRFVFTGVGRKGVTRTTTTVKVRCKVQVEHVVEGASFRLLN